MAQPPAHGSMYLLTLPLRAVLALPKRSYTAAMRGETLFQFGWSGDVVAAERRHEAAGVAAAALALGVEHVEADAGADGQPLQRPGVLRVDAQVVVDVLEVARRRVVDRDACSARSWPTRLPCSSCR